MTDIDDKSAHFPWMTIKIGVPGPLCPLLCVCHESKLEYKKVKKNRLSRFPREMIRIWKTCIQGSVDEYKELGKLCSYQLYLWPPHYPGNSWVLVGTYPGIYRILCPHRPWSYPRLMQGDISFKRAGSIIPGCPHMPGLWQKVPGDGAGTYLGIYKRNVPHSPRQYPGARAVPWMSQSTKLNPQASSCLSLGSGGWGYNR